MKMSQLTDFYKSQCTALHIKEQPNGCLHYDNDEIQADFAFIADGAKQHFKLPTKDSLRSLEDNEVAFDPLSENILRKISPLQRNLLVTFGLSSEETMITLIDHLLEVAVNPESQKSLKPSQAKVMDMLVDVGEATIKQWSSVRDKILSSDERDNRLVICALQKKVKLGSRTFGRGCVFRFPLWEVIKDDDVKDIFGVKVSGKTTRIIRDIMRYLLPSLSADDKPYSAGSDNDGAPYYCAFTLAMYRLYSDLYTAGVKAGLKKDVEHLGEFLENDFLEIDDKDSEGAFDKVMMQFRNLIPTQDGSDGEAVDDVEEAPKENRLAKRLNTLPEQKVARPDAVRKPSIGMGALVGEATRRQSRGALGGLLGRNEAPAPAGGQVTLGSLFGTNSHQSARSHPRSSGGQRRRF